MKHSFTVTRNKWTNGSDPRLSSLLRNDGKMCCLGFLARSCGASEKDILEKAKPDDVKNLPWPEGVLVEKPKDPEKDGEMTLANSNIVDEIIQINDDSRMSEEEREVELTKLFNQLDIEIKFED